MIQKLTRIKKIGPSANDPFSDYDKLVLVVTRNKPETTGEAAYIQPSEVKYLLRASKFAVGLEDRELNPDKLLRVLQDNIQFDSESITEEE